MTLRGNNVKELESVFIGLGVLYWTVACINQKSDGTILSHMAGIKERLETCLGTDSIEAEEPSAEQDLEPIVFFSTTACEIASSVEDKTIEASVSLLLFD